MRYVYPALIVVFLSAALTCPARAQYQGGGAYAQNGIPPAIMYVPDESRLGADGWRGALPPQQQNQFVVPTQLPAQPACGCNEGTVRTKLELLQQAQQLRQQAQDFQAQRDQINDVQQRLKVMQYIQKHPGCVEPRGCFPPPTAGNLPVEPPAYASGQPVGPGFAGGFPGFQPPPAVPTSFGGGYGGGFAPYGGYGGYPGTFGGGGFVGGGFAPPQYAGGYGPWGNGGLPIVIESTRRRGGLLNLGGGNRGAFGNSLRILSPGNGY